MRHSLVFTLILFALGRGHLAAQTAVQSPDDRRDAMLRQLVARVESLEAEVKELRAEKAQRESVSGTERTAALDSSKAAKKLNAPLPAGDVDTGADGETMTGAEEAETHPHFPDVQFHGFADIRYGATS